MDELLLEIVIILRCLQVTIEGGIYMCNPFINLQSIQK